MVARVQVLMCAIVPVAMLALHAEVLYVFRLARMGVPVCVRIYAGALLATLETIVAPLCALRFARMVALALARIFAPAPQATTEMIVAALFALCRA